MPENVTNIPKKVNYKEVYHTYLERKNAVVARLFNHFVM